MATVRIPHDTLAIIDQMGRADGRNRSAMIVRLLETHPAILALREADESETEDMRKTA